MFHQALHYSQIYSFTLNHDYKFRTIIMLKNIQVSKYENVYVFLCFQCFEHMDPFLWNILNFTKKLKWFGEHLIKEKGFWYKKTTWPHVFLECFKHIKWLLKHGEFSWKFCSCNFEDIRNYYNIYNIIVYLFWYSVPMVIFEIFKKQFKKIVHIVWFLFFTFTPRRRLPLEPIAREHEFVNVLEGYLAWRKDVGIGLEKDVVVRF